MILQSITHQIWYDDPESLVLKYNISHYFGLRGVGMWNADAVDFQTDPEGAKKMWDALPAYRKISPWNTYSTRTIVLVSCVVNSHFCYKYKQLYFIRLVYFIPSCTTCMYVEVSTTIFQRYWHKNTCIFIKFIKLYYILNDLKVFTISLWLMIWQFLSILE